MDAPTTITLPFQTPAEVERAAWLLAALAQSGVRYFADKDGPNWLLITLHKNDVRLAPSLQ